MGTHPIFESDFDCLTEMRQSLVRAAKKHHGHTPMVGNVGMGRHFDPTKHLTLQEMKNKSVYYNDVYLDGSQLHARVATVLVQEGTLVPHCLFESSLDELDLLVKPFRFYPLL